MSRAAAAPAVEGVADLGPGAAGLTLVTDLLAGGDSRQLGEMDLVHRFHVLLKIRAIHEWSNKATQSHATRLVDTLTALLGARGALAIDFYEDSVFFDSEKLRVSARGFEIAAAFCRGLNACGVGGLELRLGVGEPELRVLVDALMNGNGPPTHAAVQRALDARGVKCISVSGRHRLRWMRGGAVRVDARTFVVETYAKLLAVLRRYVEHLGQPEELLKQSVAAQRVVQDLVDISYVAGRRLLALAAIKCENDPFYYHSANVVALSIMLGHRLGLGKAELGDLGFAALFHDIGKAFGAETVHELAAIPGSNHEHTPFAMPATGAAPVHAMRATEHFFGYPRFGEAHVRRLLATYDRGNPPDHDARAVTGSASGTLLGDIIAIADEYDEITTHRASRPALVPDEALSRMWADRGKRFDRSLLKLFIGLVGVVPLGTLVELGDGSLGLVMSCQSDPELASRPFVLLVQNAQGNPVKGPLIDLAERRGADFAHSIVGRRDPRGLGINVPGILLS